MIEIERKFLVDMGLWERPQESRKMKQAYIGNETCTVRVRIADDKAFLTIKGHSTGISRKEFEYEIPVKDAEQMMEYALWPPVEKTRYIEFYGGKRWEIDVFEGANAGLVVAEIELGSENEAFEMPAWAAKEVSDDKRYTNSSLSAHPYSEWGSSKPSSNLK